jgi:hypothetical protein
MPIDIGDVVRYIAKHHQLPDTELGRVCKTMGTTYRWVNFPTLGCVPVKLTSLAAAQGAAPNCDGCPGH